MPLADPTVALHVATAQPGVAATNPLALITGIAQAKKTMAEAGMEQQSLAAHQTAGQIFATSPDAATAIQRLRTNPLTSAFAPELAQNWAGTQNALLAAQSTTQSMATNAFGLATKALVSGIHDPSMLDSTLQGITALVPPAAKGQVTQAFGALKKGLMSGLPTDADGKLTPEGMADYQKRLADTYSSFAGSADAVYGSTGHVKPEIGFVPGVGPNGEGAFVYKGGTPTGPIQAGPVEQPGGQAPLLGLSPAESARQTAEGQTVGDLQRDMTAEAQTLPQELIKLRALQNTISIADKGFQAGGGASMRSELAQSAQALKNLGIDISSDTINKIGNQNLSKTQLFDALIRPAMVSAISQASKNLGGRGVTANEINKQIESLSPDASPDTIREYLNIAMHKLQVENLKTQKWPEFKGLVKSGKLPGWDLEDFPIWYNKNFGVQVPESFTPAMPATLLPQGSVVGGEGAQTPVVPSAGRKPLSSFFTK